MTDSGTQLAWVPDILLPAQFFGAAAASERQPEHRLMLAVLQDAVATVLNYAGSEHARARRLVREAEAWIDARSADWPFSFDNICAALGLHAGALRQRLRVVRTQENARPGPHLLPVRRRIAGRRHQVAAPRVHRRRVAR